jgi:hypothetical protein
MEAHEVKAALKKAVAELQENDGYLLENNLSERCIAARLAMYLQPRFPDFMVDIEYNRDGTDAKMLGLSSQCANFLDEDDRAYVVPDVVVHRRGPDGPNLLVIELKKTTNRKGTVCDGLRVRAFREQFYYSYGALVLCETRRGRRPAAALLEWLA